MYIESRQHVPFWQRSARCPDAFAGTPASADPASSSLSLAVSAASSSSLYLWYFPIRTCLFALTSALTFEILRGLFNAAAAASEKQILLLIRRVRQRHKLFCLFFFLSATCCFSFSLFVNKKTWFCCCPNKFPCIYLWQAARPARIWNENISRNVGKISKAEAIGTRAYKNLYIHTVIYTCYISRLYFDRFCDIITSHLSPQELISCRLSGQREHDIKCWKCVAIFWEIFDCRLIAVRGQTMSHTDNREIPDI